MSDPSPFNCLLSSWMLLIHEQKRTNLKSLEAVFSDSVLDVVVPPLGGRGQMRKGLLSKAIILAYLTTNTKYNNRIKKGYT